MAAAVAREKCHALPFQGADHNCIGGIAERSFHADLARIGEARHGIQPAASDDGELDLFTFRAGLVWGFHRAFFCALCNFCHFQSTFIGSASKCPSRSRMWAAWVFASWQNSAIQPS